MQIIYLNLEQIILIHQDQIDRYGGSHGIRDLALLESAAYRSQTTFDGKDLYSSLFDKAASLLYSLVQNYVFVDGNKRTGVVSLIVFLELNNKKLTAKHKELVSFILEITNKKKNMGNISNWIKLHSRDI